ncbi:MAG TPA: transglycosylase SLT domain-containing protein [Polyangiaceae bacterium]|nr:transglycosylase SLT domain-containing protein [Polyangiaceae bacterium]HNZ25474.1 transglycosylase SLT domain-containing protein [Polyangiaceae bacterium]HOD25205.1 transglycosylase SLT domain-containing protein [Polyangiaceae bacterium]HOE51795.1 transglycosylase SLT domain-containing protein [Polyangiaceae bacterium]HOH03694.1 transglycosylase SLT domain-containing protein [Polyangiaceae bacterium]
MLWTVVLGTTQLIGCGCGSLLDRPRDMAPADAADVGMHPSASVAASVSAPQVARSDPLQWTPVLHDPRLTAVRVAFEAQDIAQASQQMREAMQRHQPQGVELCRWSLLLGRMLMQGKDPAGAALALDRAASEPSWILRDMAGMEAAEAYLAAGDVERAKQRLPTLSAESLSSERGQLLRIEIVQASGDEQQAVHLWKQRLSVHPHGPRWEVGALRVARALLDSSSREAEAIEALPWLRRIMSEVPTSSFDKEARALETIALQRLSPQRIRDSAWPIEMKMRRCEALVNQGRRNDALRELDELLEGMSPSQQQQQVGCLATSLAAKLRSQVKKTRNAGADTYEKAVLRCAQHKQELVGVLYAGAKIQAQVGRLPQAMAWFGRVENEFPQHRLADDARWRGARVALLMHQESKFESMLSTMGTDYPDGDMVEDGLFELAMHHIDHGSWPKAKEVLEQSTQVRPREKPYWVAGRALYFLARSLEITGQKQRALDTYQQIVLDYPLSYYMVLAHGRLRARAPEKAAQALRDAQLAGEKEKTPQAHGPKLDSPAFHRAIEWLRLGDVASAKYEIKSLDFGDSDGDDVLTVAEMYERAGDARLAHQVARSQAERFSRHYPEGRWRKAWQLAYPQVYLDIVRQETDASSIPISLAYGIMREESAFDPAVVSWADAYGLMQLIMPTATTVARSLHIKVDETSLKRPEINIKLGCRLLGSLRTKFPTTPELAIPSYNAGAGATQRWLRERVDDDFDLWVERIAYEETRGYTKRVLSSVAVYAYLYEPKEWVAASQLPDQLD